MGRLNRRNFLRAATGCAVAAAAVPVVATPNSLTEMQTAWLEYKGMDWGYSSRSVALITRIDRESKTVYLEYVDPTPEQLQQAFSRVTDITPITKYVPYARNPEKYL